MEVSPLFHGASDPPADVHISSQILFLRKSHGSRLNIFAPAHDLTSLSRSGSLERALVRGHKNDVQIAGGEVLSDEYSDYVVKVRCAVLPCASAVLIRDRRAPG